MLALHGLYGVALEITGTGRILPMLRPETLWPETFIAHSARAYIFDHGVSAALFSIFPIAFAIRKRRQRPPPLPLI